MSSRPARASLIPHEPPPASDREHAADGHTTFARERPNIPPTACVRFTGRWARPGRDGHATAWRAGQVRARWVRQQREGSAMHGAKHRPAEQSACHLWTTIGSTCMHGASAPRRESLGHAGSLWRFRMGKQAAWTRASVTTSWRRLVNASNLVRIRLSVVVAVSAAALSCAESDTGDAHDQSIGETCTGNGDCVAGAICAVGGQFSGLCTASCDSTSDCETAFGSRTSCRSGYCGFTCGESVGGCFAGTCTSGVCTTQ